MDEVLVVGADAQANLHGLELRTLLIDGAVGEQQLALEDLALMRQEDELAALFELAPQLFELVGALDVAGARLARLADLAAAEAHKGVHLVGVLVGLELERGVQRPADVGAALPPVLIDVLSVVHDLGQLQLVQAADHVVVWHDGLVDGGKGRGDGGGVLEDLHDLLEVGLGELRAGGLLLVVRLEELVVLLGHVILAADALFYGLREADVVDGLLEGAGVERVVVDGALHRRGHRDLLDGRRSGALQGDLQMVFLERGKRGRGGNGQRRCAAGTGRRRRRGEGIAGGRS